MVKFHVYLIWTSRFFHYLWKEQADKLAIKESLTYFNMSKVSQL